MFPEPLPCTSTAAADELAQAGSTAAAKGHSQYPGLSQTCVEHLTPPRGMARNNLQPCQAHDLVLQAEAELLLEEAATRVEGTEAYQSKQTLGGDRRAAKVIALSPKKKEVGKH